MKKKKLRKADIVMIIMGTASLIFIITMIWLFFLYQTVPDALIVAFFASVSLEGGWLAMIKCTDTKHGGE